MLVTLLVLNQGKIDHELEPAHAYVRVWLTRLIAVKQIGIAVNFSTVDRFKV